jgi:outer membrane protein
LLPCYDKVFHIKVPVLRATRSALAAIVLAAGITAPALAQEAGAPTATTIDPNEAAETITVGAGGVYLPDYEGSNDYRFTAAPAAIGSYKGFAFQVLGNRGSIDLIPTPITAQWDIQAGPIGVVNFDRSNVKQIDDRRIRALGELDTAIELGGYIGVGKSGVITSPYDKITVSLSYRHDVSDVHDSHIWQPTISYYTPLSLKSAVGIFASAERVGNGYARTYFDVNGAQSVASGLPGYRTRDNWKNYTLGAVGTYSLTGDLLKGFKIVAGGTYKRMLGDFGASPVVRQGSRNQWLGAVGLAYTF